MAPKRKQPETTKSRSSGTVAGTISTKPGDKEEQAKARALKRAGRVEARLAEAEKRKEAGNAHFRAGEYHEAIDEYEAAIEIHGPSVPCLSNLAAAWLKLEKYDKAELCAHRALVLDPMFMKARYRRGLARKGNLEFARAAVDFQTVLCQDLSSTEVKNVLRETFALMRARNDVNDFAGSSDDSPLLGETKLELESVSDSSDWNHGGNGIPCRFYNHGGCKRGNACRFSHAPDHKSVRDRLGRNVCIYFLLGDCKFGSSACVYAHDKAYLPTGRWWEKRKKRRAIRFLLNSMDPDEIPVAMPYILGLIDNRMAWAAHSIEVEDLFVPLGPQSLETFRGIIDIGLTTDWIEPGRGGPSGSDQIPQFDNEAEWDSWIEEGTDGDDDDSTEEENMESLCQRFKTWHDDPWAIRDALYPP